MVENTAENRKPHAGIEQGIVKITDVEIYKNNPLLTPCRGQLQFEDGDEWGFITGVDGLTSNSAYHVVYEYAEDVFGSVVLRLREANSIDKWMANE